MYNIKNNVRYKLYDKEKEQVVGYFDNMYEIRNFIESKIVFSNSVNFDSLCFEFSTYDSDYIIKDLSMDLVKRYRKVRFDIGAYKTVPHKRLVIIDDNGKVFNYSEIVNELVAIHRGNKITFGLGKTYRGNPYTPKDWKNRPITYRGMLGYKRHGKGSGSYNLVVNKRERVNSQPKFHGNDAYIDIVDEIAETSHIDVPIQMIKSAYNSMRENRRNLANNVWEDGYTYQSYKYGRPESWKNHKKTRQWCRGKNRHRFTSKYGNPVYPTDITEIINTMEEKEVA